jgi:biopolymer transport protein ExbD
MAADIGRQTRRHPIADINVTPFVDAVVLLIIFMLTAHVMESA